MQAVVSSVEEQLSVVLPKEIFRRRLRLEETMRSTTARCLFGVPDPIEVQNFVDKVYESNMMEFEAQWNWNVELGEPFSHPNETSDDTDIQGDTIKSETYYWKEILEADFMAKSNFNRFDVPNAPNTRPITLLFAPSDININEGVIPLENKNESSEPQKAESMFASKSSSGQVQRVPESPSGDHNNSSSSNDADASISRKEIRLSPPPMKQRCITDYMKVKKHQLGRKGMR